MQRYRTEQDVIGDLVSEFPALPARIIARILHAYLESDRDLEVAARATRARIDDALHHG